MNDELAAILQKQHDQMMVLEAQLNALVAENERLRRETDLHLDFRLPEKFDGTDSVIKFEIVCNKDQV